MTFTDNLLSFDCGINAVRHMEQEDPWSSRHALYIYTFLQLKTNKKIFTTFMTRKVWASLLDLSIIHNYIHSFWKYNGWSSGQLSSAVLSLIVWPT